MAEAKAAEEAPAEPEKVEEVAPAKPVKKESKGGGGFLGFGKKKPTDVPWQDTYEVTLTRGVSYKVRRRRGLHAPINPSLITRRLHGISC